MCLALVMWGMVSYGAGQRGTTRFFRYQSVGVFGGVTSYAGDLSYSSNLGFPARQLGTFRTMGPAVGIQYGWQFHPHAALRLSVTGGQFEATDLYAYVSDLRRIRQLHTQTNLVEAGAIITYDWFGNDRTYRFRPYVSPYLLAGISVVGWESYSYTDVRNEIGRTRLNGLQTEGVDYATLAIAIPFGFGIRWRLSDRFDLRTEIGLRYTFTDYLDDVSGQGDGIGGYRRTYDDGNEAQRFFGDRRASALGDNRRGNPNTNDWYVFTGASLSYILVDRDPCPYPFRRMGIRRR